MQYTPVGLSSLLAALSTTSVTLSLNGPEIIISAPLGAVCAFCGAGSAVLTNLSKKLDVKVTKHEKIYSLPTAKHNSINTLVSKSLSYNVFTD